MCFARYMWLRWRQGKGLAGRAAEQGVLSDSLMAAETVDFERECERLIQEIERDARETAHFFGKARFEAAVLTAIAKVPREAFVPAAARPFAYINRPLAIGHGQTISQPYIVAAMTDMLALTPAARVLEIGTGCGYQAAVLAEIAAEVVTVETIPDLAAAATERLARLGYDNVTVHVGDGWKGWPGAAPYDAIIVTAAAAEMPAGLVAQLAPGGRMAIPLGRPHETQRLVLVETDADGRPTESVNLPVAFVPLVKGD